MNDQATGSDGVDGRRRFANILDMAEEGIVAIDCRQRIVLFNHGAEKIFGHRAPDVLGKSIDLLIPSRFADRHPKLVCEFACASEDARLMGERRAVTGRRQDGSEFPAEISICKFQEGGEQCFAAIVRDVSERKKIQDTLIHMNQQLEERVRARTAELESSNRQLHESLAELNAKTDELRSTSQQLWQAAKLASVGELAASIAHELNNPLGTVSLRVESILGQTPAHDPRRQALEIVEQEVERMAHLVANLLQFSRHGKEQVSTVNLDDEILMTAELTRHHLQRRGIEIHHDFGPRLPPIFADRQKLRQVFLNLFTNAGDAMPRGGRLITRVRQAESPAGQLQIVIEVSDTGSGIPPEVLPRVMDPFFTTKEEGKGTGLGLAICKRIVQEHKGVIHLDSEVGKGTTVRITLPVASAINTSQLA
jgi:two-component system, LuxR family, sensor kinase FixL